MIVLVDAFVWASVFIATLGILQCLAGWVVLRRFAGPSDLPMTVLPPVTLLKPLCGDEPLLEEALVSSCRQAYPDFQIVFGVQDPLDPALAIVDRLRDRFPDLDVTVTIDPTPHGTNRKISNLMNMMPAARHDLLVFSDSDLHVGPDYLERLAVALHQPGVGLVSTLYVGLPSGPSLWQRLGATQISHVFLPGALLARAFGRQDCLGNTMILRRETLELAGGLRGLVNELADDNVLGQRVRHLGLKVTLADIVTAVTVPEASPRAMWLHEIRWARTIRALAPVGFAASAIQYPIFWASFALLLSRAAPWGFALLGVAWATRAAAAAGIERKLRSRLSRPPASTPAWMLPLRDFLSIAEIVASFASNRVVWRGHIFQTGGRTASRPAE